ncbi:MAG: PHP domain-containing protein [Fibrobacter sp.]|jgi:predicted metal-dependent phosphoesterase TrpH|nr:PHP domain-containing protein [Fibrobacter sp.]
MSAVKKKPEFADLHLHTNLSDGVLSVDEVVKLSLRKGLRCISITDHDDLDSYRLAQKSAEGSGLEIISGIEISSVWQGKDIHILGYFCDPTNLALNLELKEAAKARMIRVRAIVKKLNLLGIDITFEKVMTYCKGRILGRPHVAMSLVDEEYVSSFSDAFTKYLGEGSPAFVEKKGLTPGQTIRLIENAGGIAVLAHPYKTSADLLIENLVEWGLKGIETYSPSQKGNAGKRYREIAKRFHLVGTGGSDFHFEGGPNGINSMKMPYSVVEELRERRENSRAEWF